MLGLLGNEQSSQKGNWEMKEKIIHEFVEFEKRIEPLLHVLVDADLRKLIAVSFDMEPALDLAGKEIAQESVNKLRSSMPQELLSDDADFFFTLRNHIVGLSGLAFQLAQLLGIFSTKKTEKVLSRLVQAAVNFAKNYYLSLCIIASAYQGDEGEEAKKVHEYVVSRIRELAQAWSIDEPCV